MLYFAAVDLEQKIIGLSIKTVAISASVLILTTLLAIAFNKGLPKKRFNKYKLPFFLVMLATTVICTFILAFNTVYLNVSSESKGPVHWHADIEFWACGNEVELRNPVGVLSNKIGTSTYHEHNDKRIHLEGVVVDKNHDASLGKFMEVTGGYINKQGVGIPVNEQSSEWLAASNHQDGDQQSKTFLSNMSQYVVQGEKGEVLALQNGDMACNGRRGEVQVFVYRYNKATKSYTQTKVTNPAHYIVRDESVVPPGDCIIVEFDQKKDSTDRLCQQFGVRDTARCVEFGVKENDPELCNIRYEGVN